MKKIGLILIIILFIFLIIPKEEKDFRIRVIANSNSEIDTKEKMKVVNVILNEINKYDSEDKVNEIKRNLNKLDEKIKTVLNHDDYSIEIKKTYFPPKEYKNKVISGGKYLALVIVIKNGEGKNWWTLLNPSFDKGFEDDCGEVEMKFYFFEKLKNCFK